MNTRKQCCITLCFALCITQITWSGDTKEEIKLPGEEIYVNPINPMNIDKQDQDKQEKKDNKEQVTCHFDVHKRMTTEEIGEYLNQEFDAKIQKIKPSCPFPYNAMIDAKHSFLFGGPLGLYVYALSKSIICGLKKAGICKTDKIKNIRKSYKDIHAKGFNTISGYRTKAEVKRVSFAQKSCREHIATGFFWLLKRLYVSGMVLGTTWFLNKYVLSQSIKDKLAWYDFKITDPVFRAIAQFNIWRFAYNPIMC